MADIIGYLNGRPVYSISGAGGGPGGGEGGTDFGGPTGETGMGNNTGSEFEGQGSFSGAGTGEGVGTGGAASVDSGTASESGHASTTGTEFETPGSFTGAPASSSSPATSSGSGGAPAANPEANEPQGSPSSDFDTGEGTEQNTSSKSFSDNMGDFADARAAAEADQRAEDAREGARAKAGVQHGKDVTAASEANAASARAAAATALNVAETALGLLGPVGGLIGRGATSLAREGILDAAETSGRAKDFGERDPATGSLLDTGTSSPGTQFGDDITGLATGDYDNPEGNPGATVAAPVAAPPKPAPAPEPDGGHGGEGFPMPDVPDIPEPPEIPPVQPAPKFPNPSNIIGGGPSTQTTAKIIDDANKYGKQSTLVSGIEDDDSLGDIGMPGLTPAAGSKTVTAAQSTSQFDNSVIQEFDELEAEQIKGGSQTVARDPLEGAKTPPPSGYTLIRSYSTIPFDVLRAPDGTEVLRNIETGEIIPNMALPADYARA